MYLFTSLAPLLHNTRNSFQRTAAILAQLLPPMMFGDYMITNHHEIDGTRAEKGNLSWMFKEDNSTVGVEGYSRQHVGSSPNVDPVTCRIRNIQYW
jgi:hypothetical protein